MIYGIEDKTLTALGDAVRNKTSKYIGVDAPISKPIFTLTVESPNNSEEWHDVSVFSGYKVYDVMLDFKEILGEIYDIAERLYYTFSYETTNDVFDVSINWRGEPYSSSFLNDPTFIQQGRENSAFIKSGEVYGVRGDHNYCSLRIGTNSGNELKPYKCKITINVWGAYMDNKIVEFNTMTPMEMINKLNNLDILPAEAYVISGECENMFKNKMNIWLIRYFGNKINTNNITSVSNMFNDCDDLKEIPLIINCNTNTSMSVSAMFSYCQELKIPPIVIVKPGSMLNLFSNCHNLRIPDNYFDTWIWTTDYSSSSASSNSMSGIFQYCYSLRQYPEAVYQHINPKASYGNTIYNNMISNCYSMDELINIPVYIETTYTSNMFKDSFTECDRLMNMTFATQEDGTPYAVKWKSQTIDLSKVGYYAGFDATIDGRCAKYNSGITTDKRVFNDETYQALKNDPDWFCGNILRYSRYNHDSAVRTINSLPDASAYGTNTIKFKGEAGSATDGGAINTLTAEEIAVATAKGWTVSFV